MKSHHSRELTFPITTFVAEHDALFERERTMILMITCSSASLEGRPHGSNKHFTSRRLPQWITKELGAGNESNGRSTKEHEEAVRQEKEESLRIEDWQ